MFDVQRFFIHPDMKGEDVAPVVVPGEIVGELLLGAAVQIQFCQHDLLFMVNGSRDDLAGRTDDGRTTGDVLLREELLILRSEREETACFVAQDTDGIDDVGLRGECERSACEEGTVAPVQPSFPSDVRPAHRMDECPTSEQAEHRERVRVLATDEPTGGAEVEGGHDEP